MAKKLNITTKGGRTKGFGGSVVQSSPANVGDAGSIKLGKIH